AFLWLSQSLPDAYQYRASYCLSVKTNSRAFDISCDKAWKVCERLSAFEPCGGRCGGAIVATNGLENASPLPTPYRLRHYNLQAA
ncbi:MAG TPA: hypothetical protein VF766_00370, partial [Pyrinomonadaceae bacterium]